MPPCSCQSIQLGHDVRGTNFDQIKHAMPANWMVTETATQIQPSSHLVYKDFYLSFFSFLFIWKPSQRIIMHQRYDGVHCDAIKKTPKYRSLILCMAFLEMSVDFCSLESETCLDHCSEADPVLRVSFWPKQALIALLLVSCGSLMGDIFCQAHNSFLPICERRINQMCLLSNLQAERQYADKLIAAIRSQ